MFTGIIKELGKVYTLSKMRDTYRLAVESNGISKEVAIGGSVSVNGVCLTVVEKKGPILFFDCIEETVRKTNLKNLKNKDLVNLEDSLKTGDPLSGHFVLGHIDCTGRIRDIEKGDANASIEIECPEDFVHFIVEKGSVAIDGISLTIGEAKGNRFKVYVIPYTLEMTTLGLKKRGDEVNIEFDIIGKYVLRSKGSGGYERLTEEFLKEKGFV